MNNELINAIHDLALKVSAARQEADELDAKLKDAIKEVEAHRASFIMAHASDGERKSLSTSSTVALVRNAIEIDVMTREDYRPLHDINQARYDLLAAKRRKDDLYADHEKYKMQFYGAFADHFGDMERIFTTEALTPAAGRVLPIVPTPVR